MNALPTQLGIKDLLALATSKVAPYIKRRRVVSPTRAIYSVRSDVLYYYTENWNRNRNADHVRVQTIMKSIEAEGEVDNRIYVALIQRQPAATRLMAYDGNHRREALIQLYLIKHKTYWVDLDVLVDVSDAEVIRAFQRVNQSICLPDSYIEYETETDANATAEPPETQTKKGFKENRVAYCESWLLEIGERWPGVLVAKNRTRIPYCIKNDMADFLMDYFRLGGSEENLMIRLEMMNEEHRLSVETKSVFIQNTARALNCFLFTEGIGKIRRTLLPSRPETFMIL